MRIIRRLLMILALLAMVGHPASAGTCLHGEALSLQAPHHHHSHGIDVAAAGHAADAVGHTHHHPVHHDDGKCCDGMCCGSSFLSATTEPISGSMNADVVKVRVPVGDRRPDGTILSLPDRPPIAI